MEPLGTRADRIVCVRPLFSFSAATEIISLLFFLRKFISLLSDDSLAQQEINLVDRQQCG
jgi:hypothetical protein